MRGKGTHAKKQLEYVGFCLRSAQVDAMRVRHTPKFLSFYSKNGYIFKKSNKNGRHSRHPKDVLGQKYGGITLKNNLKLNLKKN